MKNKRKKDPYLDRRSGEDRRIGYDLDYFQENGTDRRKNKERRSKVDRREDSIPVSDWTSICPTEDEDEHTDEES